MPGLRLGKVNHATRDLVDYPDHPLTLMTAGTWIAVSDSYITDEGLNPDPAVTPESPLSTAQWGILDGNTQNAGMYAYSGGVYIPARKKVYINGGGHADYHGNEWYAFSLVTMLWEHVNWPDPRTSIPNSYTDGSIEYGDVAGVPSAYHTYNGIQYSTVSGTLLRGGGAPSAGDTGTYIGATWTYDIDTNTWTELTHTNTIEASSQRSQNLILGCYDSINDIFWQHTQYALWSRDASNPTTPTMRYVGDGADSWYFGSEVQTIYASMCHDPANNIIFVMNSGETDTLIYDVSNPAAVGRPTKLSSWTGDGTSILDTGSPLAFDPIGGDFVSWNGGTMIYAIHPVELTSVIETASVSNAITPSAPHISGTYGRFGYCGAWGGKSVFFLTNSVSGAMYFYKRA